MADAREKLASSRRKLVQALGDKEKAYWSNMKAWFKYRITKEEFDNEARSLLSKEESHLHNKFLLAVLTKCHLHGSSSTGNMKESASSQASNKAKKNQKLQAIKRKFDHRFAYNQPSSTTNVIQEHRTSKSLPPSGQQPIKMCSKSLQVPSIEEVGKFVSVISWEMGLDDATDEAVELVTEAIRVFLKNILSAIFSRHSAYKVYNKTFKYSMGCESENPYLLNQSSLSSRVLMNQTRYANSKEIEQEKMESLGRQCQTGNPCKVPVGMYDLLHTLQVFQRSVIPSHTVYTLASERILANLWHPDRNELKQDEIISKLMVDT